MPELPEVETIRRELEPVLKGKVIAEVTVRRADVVGHPKSVEEFKKRLSGCRICALSRRGKYLVFELNDGAQLVVHLRLSGRLVVVRSHKIPKYERVRLRFGNGRYLYLSFVEPRSLGRMYYVRAGEMPRTLAGMRRMGMEPIEPRFDNGYLADRLKGRRTSVKAVLLDQRVCCGVGNIYSDEALFRAGIRPTTTAATLRPARVNTLARHLRQVLKDGIKRCGTTMDDGRYVRPDGRAGGFQDKLAVFGREGQPCPKCRSTIRTESVAGRTSHYCPKCQR